MNSLLRRCILTLAALATLGVRLAVAAPPAPLKLPEFESLAAKASESVNVSLDSSLLGLAAGFLDPKDPEDAAAKQLIAGLKGIYVRNYTFDQDITYPAAEVEALRVAGDKLDLASRIVNAQQPPPNSSNSGA